MWKDFKDFAFKGNVIDMAVGVMIGTAFGGIVTSLVGDLLMPLLSILTGKVDLTSLSLTIGEGADAPVVKYGAFLQTIINFLLIAISIFLLVKGINSLRTRMSRKAPAEPAPDPRLCPYCKMQIDDAAIRCPNCTSHLQ